LPRARRFPLPVSRRLALLLAGLTGFLGIALGAFGAHALNDVLEARHTREIWNTAVIYHLVHAPVLLWLARGSSVSAASFLSFIVGILFFSGSLYALAVTGINWLGVITPVGGLLLMAGWLFVAVGGWRSAS
jgi:uncharacterized membrane protein YgdD (TMEM256/DUF423 family)